MSNRASKQPSVLDQNLLLCKLQICRNRCLINLTLNQIFAMLTFNNKEFLEKWFYSIVIQLRSSSIWGTCSQQRTTTKSPKRSPKRLTWVRKGLQQTLNLPLLESMFFGSRVFVAFEKRWSLNRSFRCSDVRVCKYIKISNGTNWDCSNLISLCVIW